MSERVEATRNALNDLIEKGFGLPDSQGMDALRRDYQSWYTRSLPFVRQLLPDRHEEFTLLYEGRKDENGIRFDLSGYHLSGWPREKLQMQADILASAADRLEGRLSDLRGLLQADLFDSEIDAARHLADNGHLRAAGAVAGVVLEGHLKELVQKHQNELNLPGNRKPTIADYNDALKKSDVFDIPTWRGIQRLTDIRNLCDHKSDKEPTPDQVAELIDGTDKATKTLA
jgi:hypothetical protein